MLIGDGTRMLKNETNWHRMLILLRTLNKYQIYLLRNLNRILQNEITIYRYYREIFNRSSTSI